MSAKSPMRSPRQIIGGKAGFPEVSGGRAWLRGDTQSPGLSAWLGQLPSRVHTNVAPVALANKMARVAWAVLAKSEAYRPPLEVISTEAVACN
jgi:hypothetical protein